MIAGSPWSSLAYSCITWPMCVSLSEPCPSQSQSLDLEPILIQFDLILTNYVCKDPIQIRLHSQYWGLIYFWWEHKSTYNRWDGFSSFWKFLQFSWIKIFTHKALLKSLKHNTNIYLSFLINMNKYVFNPDKIPFCLSCLRAMWITLPSHSNWLRGKWLQHS